MIDRPIAAIAAPSNQSHSLAIILAIRRVNLLRHRLAFPLPLGLAFCSAPPRRFGRVTRVSNPRLANGEHLPQLNSGYADARILAICTLVFLSCACRRASQRVEPIIGPFRAGRSVRTRRLGDHRRHRGIRTASDSDLYERGSKCVGVVVQGERRRPQREHSALFECNSSYAINVEVSAAFEGRAAR